MKATTFKSHNQQGVALFVALIILLAVSMMGVSAMRGGIFHERMASNAEAEELTFQGAESAIGGVIAQAVGDDGVLAEMMDKSPASVLQCTTRTAGMQSGACGTDEENTIDARKTIIAEANSQFDRRRPIIGSDAASVMDYQFHTLGAGRFLDQTNMRYENENYQEWRRIGPGGLGMNDDSNHLRLRTSGS